MLLHPYARVKLHTNLKVASANLDLHVAELADGAEAAALLPQAAHRLVAHSRLTVSKRAAVSLEESRRYTNVISPEHCWDFYLFYVYIYFTNGDISETLLQSTDHILWCRWSNSRSSSHLRGWSWLGGQASSQVDIFSLFSCGVTFLQGNRKVPNNVTKDHSHSWHGRSDNKPLQCSF